MSDWGFLTNHALALGLIARAPESSRLRSIAAELDVTERTAYGIVDDLARHGFIVKHKHGRHNRYTIQRHLPVPTGRGTADPTVGDLLDLMERIEP